MISPTYNEAVCAQITSALNLRKPNAGALTTIAFDAAEHFETPDAGLFEGVVEMATGVGKTYVMAAAIDYFAALGFRNFAIITPGRTITRKTIANFTPGHKKSLLAGMETQPMVITSANFGTPAVARALEDESIVKLYIFTVQALLKPTPKAVAATPKPTTKSDRKTHEFDENLGADLYQRLKDVGDLIVLADEYHLYKAKQHSSAVRGLSPQMLFGLTATAPAKSPIIYSYPLAAAIADGFVKTPVLDGRKDDRKDTETKLSDGLRLLETKTKAMVAYRTEHPELPVVNPVMLVLAPDTGDADEVVGILRRPDFAGGAFAEAILNIHSNVTDKEEALAQLDAVEEPDSKVRVIVSVGMLKEGWDVKNVYVICALRALASEVLTEQTLGRGLRLPFGELTGKEVLDTLDVVAHERYDQLIAKVEKMKVELIDYRTAQAVKAGTPASSEAELPAVPAQSGAATMGTITISDMDERLAHSDEGGFLGPELRPRAVTPPLMFPAVTTMPITQEFSLNEITDLEPFRQAGRKIAATPEENLRRSMLVGTVTEQEGRRIASLTQRRTSNQVGSSEYIVSLDQSVERIVRTVLDSGAVARRGGEVNRLREIVNTLVTGMGPDAARLLSAFDSRASSAIVELVRARRANSKPVLTFSPVIEERPFDAVRYGRQVIHDRGEGFHKGDGYTGFAKSLYTQDWFDSNSAEFVLANLIDQTDAVSYWLRLQIGDLPLPWQGGAYNPDFIVAEESGDFWVVEGKADRDINNEDVVAKRNAANQWANRVRNGTEKRWHYMFVSETDIATAKESWSALKKLSLAE